MPLKKPSVEALLNRLMKLSEERGCTLYEILRRRAGWGIVWYEGARIPAHVRDDPQHPRWKDGLVVYSYKPTLRAAVLAELKRFRTTASQL